MAVMFDGVEDTSPQVWGHEELWGRCTELLRRAEAEIPWFRVCWWVGGGGMSVRTWVGGWMDRKKLIKHII